MILDLIATSYFDLLAGMAAAGLLLLILAGRLQQRDCLLIALVGSVVTLALWTPVVHKHQSFGEIHLSLQAVLVSLAAWPVFFMVVLAVVGCIWWLCRKELRGW